MSISQTKLFTHPLISIMNTIAVEILRHDIDLYFFFKSELYLRLAFYLTPSLNVAFSIIFTNKIAKNYKIIHSYSVKLIKLNCLCTS